MAKKTKTPELSERDLDQAFIQGKIMLLDAFMKEHKIALQPILETTQFGIRPNVQLVKYDPKPQE